MSRPFPSRQSSDSFVRVNGKIRAREVRVVGVDNRQLGVFSLNDALAMARQNGVDLVEVAATASPPVCRLVNLGKFRYEKAKKEKESKKHQHASTVKEVQLSPRIDPHDLGIKVGHAVGFLCGDMKVKVALKFRGREMAHQEFGFEVVQKFLAAVAAWGHPDFEPKLIGRGIHVMVSPLPRNQRGKAAADKSAPVATPGALRPVLPAQASGSKSSQRGPLNSESKKDGFVNNPFAKLEVK